MMAPSMASIVFAHPGWWGHAWGPGGGWMWAPFILALCVAAIWFTLRGREPHSHPGIDRARAILAERYARGEISRDEYRKRLDDLD